ncbi:MAG TPA: hypothetical protein DIW31_03960 [Bacteroidales bacterium]|nr:hypothetical protein [Bacteroidales bacterium]
MSRYYTIYDIERALNFQFRDKWHKTWTGFSVYFDELVIYVQKDSVKLYAQEFSERLESFFGGHFLNQNKQIVLDYNDVTLRVTYEENESDVTKYAIPLFKSSQRFPMDRIENFKGVPVFAFHSYKGGVGRTLSLISAVHAASKINNKSGHIYKILIVDSDIEAPGLTWLASKSAVANAEISFIDALALIHSEEEWRNTIPFVARKIQETSLEMPVDKQFVEHYFLPVYRSDDSIPYQLMDVSVTPSLIVKTVDREWIIGEFLSELGQELNVDAVFVDLRAGISEYSAPLLFDPRVRKIYVSTTSLQSRMGLNVLLKEIYPSNLSQEYSTPDIFVTMVPPNTNVDFYDKIEQDLLADTRILNEQEDENYRLPLTFLDFAQELIHLEGFDMIDDKLGPTPMAKRVAEVVSGWFQDKLDEDVSISTDKSEFLENLYSIAGDMEYGENAMQDKFMVTTSLRNLAKKFRVDVPITVVLGTKGSGKTFIYGQLLRGKTWEHFSTRIDHDVRIDTDTYTYIIPFLIPKNKSNILSHVAVDQLNLSTQFNINIDDILKRILRIQEYQDQESSEARWNAFWKKEILESTGVAVETFKELQEYLEKNDKRVAFIVDGLEDIFQNITTKPEQKIAIRVLMQDIVNELRSYPKGRVGIIIFSRLDIAKNCIEQNWGQFRTQYDAYELKWNRVEALRLVLWLAEKAGLKNTLSNIERATEDALIAALESLWGTRMGKPTSREAQSANWVLAALSDLKARMQPRDLVRFLMEAAQRSMKDSESYSDRYLIPSAIRDSIAPCSNKKIEEIIQEMEFLKEIFEKLKQKPKQARQVPFRLEDYGLDREEARLLEEQGFLLELDDGYYMPEIIRYGLEFSYSKRARTKVLSLLRQANASL